MSVNEPHDRELAEIVGEDEALLGIASEVRAALHEEALDEAFLRRLRNQVVSERARVIAERQQRPRFHLPSPGWLPGPGWRIPAIAGVAVAAVLATTLLLSLLTARTPGLPPRLTVTATSSSSGVANLAPTTPLVIQFSQPMDHALTARALRIAPATSVRVAWQGNDLILTPEHGLAANTAYAITFGHNVARTATGAQLATDLHVLFGTAPVAPSGADHTPVNLTPRTVATADEGSEAVINPDGSLITTSATSYGFSGVLHIHPDGTLQRLGISTSAICVSRTGGSLAYLRGTGSSASIVMADGSGGNGHPVPVSVDSGSPLGWINDAEVSFVSGGQLKAVDRSAHVRTLAPDHIDATHDTVGFAPGGRYVYLRSGSGSGQLLDVVAHTSHPLPGSGSDVAFSADGGTVAWVDGSGPLPRIATAPSAGGLAVTLSVPVQAGDKLSDLGISPDASRLLYTVTHSDGSAELRLGALDDGATLGVSHEGGGQSPNWAASGAEVAVLGHPMGQPTIQVVDIPGSTASAADRALAVATAFVNTQLGGDQDAMHALSRPGLTVASLPTGTRALVVQARPGAAGTMIATVRIVQDPSSSHPVARAASETLEMSSSGGMVVTAVHTTALSDLPAGPHVTHIGAGPGPGTIQVGFDSDLSPASVAGAFRLQQEAGIDVPVTATYDAATRMVTLSTTPAASGQLNLVIGTSLRDVAGQRLDSTVQTPITI